MRKKREEKELEESRKAIRCLAALVGEKLKELGFDKAPQEGDWGASSLSLYWELSHGLDVRVFEWWDTGRYRVCSERRYGGRGVGFRPGSYRIGIVVGVPSILVYGRKHSARYYGSGTDKQKVNKMAKALLQLQAEVSEREVQLAHEQEEKKRQAQLLRKELGISDEEALDQRQLHWPESAHFRRNDDGTYDIDIHLRAVPLSTAKKLLSVLQREVQRRQKGKDGEG